MTFIVIIFFHRAPGAHLHVHVCVHACVHVCLCASIPAHMLYVYICKHSRVRKSNTQVQAWYKNMLIITCKCINQMHANRESLGPWDETAEGLRLACETLATVKLKAMRIQKNRSKKAKGGEIEDENAQRRSGSEAEDDDASRAVGDEDMGGDSDTDDDQDAGQQSKSSDNSGK